jgi:hypothetical protein
MNGLLLKLNYSFNTYCPITGLVHLNNFNIRRHITLGSL